MKHLIFGLLLATSSFAYASDQPTQDELVSAFIGSSSCTAVLAGADVGPGVSQEQRDYLKSAHLHFWVVSRATAGDLIKSGGQWASETYESMYNAVVDRLQQEPQLKIQTLGEACVRAYDRFAVNLFEENRQDNGESKL